MNLLLLHFMCLTWLSVGAAVRWTFHPADRLLASGALGWANLLVTELLLSAGAQLDRSWLFFGTSLGLGGLTTAVAWWRPSAPPAPERGEAGPGLGLATFVFITLGLLATASAVAAFVYYPQDGATLARALPRALLQVGSGSILPLQTADAQYVLLPFNHGLLQVWTLVYQPPLFILNAFSLLAWCGAGLALYRLVRALGYSQRAALGAAWCALAATPVVAQAATSGDTLPAAAAMVAAAAFLLRWRRDGRTADAAFGGLLAGLAAGSGTLPLLASLALVILGLGCRIGFPKGGRNAAILCLGLGLLPWLLNVLLALESGAFRLLGAMLVPSLGPSTFSLATWGALLAPPSILAPPSEETIGIGLGGLACLLAAVRHVINPPSQARPLIALAGSAIVTLAGVILASRWMSMSSADLVLPILLAAPALAKLIDPPPLSRWRSTLVSVIVAIGTLWSAQLYLWCNAHRPLAQLIDRSLASAKPSLVPSLLNHRLAVESRINFSSDDADYLLITLMGRPEHQRFTVSKDLASDAYNVISQPSLARDRKLRQLADGPVYALIPFDSKPTAGVEFLGSVGVGTLSRDYLGIGGNANDIKPIPTNNTLLLALTQIGGPDGQARLRVNLVGLNPGDHARALLWHEEPSGNQVLLASFSGQGVQIVNRPRELHRLHLRIVSSADGRDLGTGYIGESALTPEVNQPSDPRQMFVVELVREAPVEQIRVSEGLTPPEGPFPQWNLPLIRWARSSAITLSIPATPGLDLIRLRFSARLHLRTRAIMAVFCNGEIKQRLEFNDPLTWHDQTLEFAVRPGVNTIELRNYPLPPEPDWADYLERYPDVRRHIETIRQPPREGALEHYKYSGQPEGRLMRYISQPPPSADAYFFMFRSLRVEGLHP